MFFALSTYQEVGHNKCAYVTVAVHTSRETALKDGQCIARDRHRSYPLMKVKLRKVSEQFVALWKSLGNYVIE